MNSEYYDDIKNLANAVKHLKGDFNWEQLYRLFEGAYHNLTPEQIDVYANPRFTHIQMCDIGNDLIHKKIRSINKIKLYANPRFSKSQMEFIKCAVFDGILTVNQIKLFAKPEFSEGQMRYIKDNIHMPINQLKIIANPRFSTYQMKIIKEAFISGLSNERIKIITENSYNNHQIDFLKNAIYSSMPINQIKLFTNPKFDIEQMKIIESSIGMIPIDKIKLFAKPEFNSEQMKVIKSGLLCDFKDEQIKLFINPEFDHIRMKYIKNALMYGLNNDKIKIITDPRFNNKQCLFIMRDTGDKNIDLIIDPRLSIDQMKFICDADIPIDILRLCSNYKFTIAQMKIISDAAILGLNSEQISQFANPDFSLELMSLYRDVILFGIPLSDIGNTNIKCINNTEMNLIKDIISFGISFDLIKQYVFPIFDKYTLVDIKNRFETYEYDYKQLILKKIKKCKDPDQFNKITSRKEYSKYIEYKYQDNTILLERVIKNKLRINKIRVNVYGRNNMVLCANIYIPSRLYHDKKSYYHINKILKELREELPYFNNYHIYNDFKISSHDNYIGYIPREEFLADYKMQDIIDAYTEYENCKGF